MQHRTVSPSLSVSAHSQPRPQPKTKDITKIQAAEKRIKVTCKWEITDSRSQVQILTCPHLPSDESEKQAKRPPTRGATQRVCCAWGNNTATAGGKTRNESTRKNAPTTRGGVDTRPRSRALSRHPSAPHLERASHSALSWLRGRPTSHPRTPRLGIPSTTIVS